MSKKEKFRTFLILLVLSGIYIFIFSESGIIERNMLSKKYSRLAADLDTVKISNSELSRKCENIRSGIYNERDIASSGFVYKTGKLIYINENTREGTPSQSPAKDGFDINPEHLRIIWIIISAMTIVYFLLKKKNSEVLSDGTDFN